MLEISVNKAGFVKIPLENQPIVRLQNTIIVFSMNEEIANLIIDNFLNKGSEIEQVILYNYDTYNLDTESFKKGLEKIFYHSIFINNDYVKNIKIMNKDSVFYNATNEQINLSSKKITKLDGEKWPSVKDTSIKINSFNMASSTSDDEATYFYEVNVSSTQTEDHIPIEGIPDGYPEHDEEGLPLTYETVIYYHNDWYKWPLVKNISYSFGGMIVTDTGEDNTLTVRSYKVIKTEILPIGGDKNE